MGVGSQQLTVHTTRDGIAFTSGDGCFELMRRSAGLVEIAWTGVFDERACPAAEAYLSEFVAMSEACGQPLHMLHDLTGMTRYSRDILACHSLYSRSQAHTIGRIAVVSSQATVYLGVTTVAAWQRRPIRNFSSRNNALEWLGETPPPPALPLQRVGQSGK